MPQHVYDMATDAEARVMFGAAGDAALRAFLSTLSKYTPLDGVIQATHEGEATVQVKDPSGLPVILLVKLTVTIARDA